ncbi:ATP-binding protein [Streptomyces iranensis]|uniref:Regulatory protein n=1 Tax=Streptomyces iranensis TaxID=576784 RepID=A0A061A4Z5_9ACTN|nr:ATP-binding protein [Streptomyces iranensis]MBP2059035.1 two-component sensor histidine kinase [Streptomyces iranensis]CDR12035.1 regulatory protein [Streptomyces iranensis]
MFFTSSRHGARLARRIVVRRLEEWGIPRDSDASQSLALIAGELAANAVSHGHVPGRRFHLRLSVQPPPDPDGRRAPVSARIEVSDARDERRPVVREHGDDDAEGGRGLLLVDALASKWGVAERGVGKTVWCEYALASEEDRSRQVTGDTGAKDAR